jgi:NAD-dependent SIR2 family protein deacetylase
MGFEQDMRQARAWMEEADAFFVGAGAGMGVDSGLPDFRGARGFWRAYPAAERLGLSFEALASPDRFRDDPELAWGFYGHRLLLYRATTPHAGFASLRAFALARGAEPVVFTSNVDGQFQRAGYRQVLEVHGSIHFLQCTRPCSDRIWSARGTRLKVDEDTLRCVSALPRCPDCGAVARPNIQMFRDSGCNPGRIEEQYQVQQEHLADFWGRRVVVLELGAGTSIPTVRARCEQVAEDFDAPLVRINPREADVGASSRRGARRVGLALPAREALVDFLTVGGSI